MSALRRGAGVPPPPAPASGRFLTDMVRAVRRELVRGYYDQESPAPRRRPPRGRGDATFAGAVRRGRTSPALILELKRSSPGYGAGPLPRRETDEFARLADLGHASAISVIPQPHAFGGSLTDLGEVVGQSPLPVLFKDFVVHPAQIRAARRWGAQAVLLLARLETEHLLGPGVTIDRLVRETHRLGLHALLEVHGLDEVPLALSSEADLLGANARDLQTLEISVDQAATVLRSMRPDGRPLIGMSGIKGPRDVRRYTRAGATAVLVGTSVARAHDPIGLLHRLVDPIR